MSKNTLPTDDANAEPRRASPQPETIGPFRVLEVIGEGGFGVVYLAEQTAPVKRRVALKVIKPGMDSAAVIARFEAEEQALAVMDHPCIAKVFDAGTTDRGLPYFVMELVRGEPITTFCDRNRLSIEGRVRLMIRVCDAVQHAHLKGVIHRDIKPSNVLVAYDTEGEPAPKVIDFGVAKALNTRLSEHTIFTHQGQLIGTPEYMSPEQAEMSGLDIDTRADVYSLGVLLYELLTGALPFEPGTLRNAAFGEIQRIIREVEPPKPSTRLSRPLLEPQAQARECDRRAERAPSRNTPDVIAQRRRTTIAALRRTLHRDLDWIVMKCLEKDRARRYDTPSGLAQELRRFLDHEPVHAGPPSPAYRLRKFVRRNRGPVAAALFAAAVLLAATTVSLLALQRESRARADAEVARTAEAERAAQLQQVADFQSKQLGAIVPATMGVKIRRTLLDAAPEAQRKSLEQSLAGINFTGIALDTLRQNIFDRTIEAIDTQFEDQPLVQAQLLQTVADTLQVLGLLDLASDPQERALAIRRAELGDDHPDTLSSIKNMGALLLAQGRNDEAESYFREALEGRRHVLGDDHPDTLDSISDMGVLLRRTGRHDEAEAYDREAIEGRRRVLGNDHPDTLTSINNLSVLLLDRGRHEEAEEYCLEALEGRRRVLGDDDPSTLNSIGNMGDLLRTVGRYDEAEKYCREALEGRRRVLGDDHPDTLIAMKKMGYLLLAEGRYDAAERHFREALERSRRVLGEGHPSTLAAISGVGYLLRLQGRYSEAEPYYREAMEADRRVLGNDHPDTLTAINNMSVLLLQQGRYEEAEPLLREALAGRRRVLGDDHPYTLGSILNMGSLLNEQGRGDEAMPYYREALEGYRRVLGEDHPRTLTSINSMGALLLAQGRYDEAEPYFREALERQRRVFGDDHPDTLTTMNNLGYLLQDAGRYNEAEPYLRDALEGRRRALGDDHPDTLATMRSLASLLADVGRGDEALALADEAVSRGHAVFGEHHQSLGVLIAERAHALKALGRFEEAERAMLDAYDILTSALGEDHEKTTRVAEALADLYDAWHKADPTGGHDRQAAQWRTKLRASQPGSK